MSEHSSASMPGANAQQLLENVSQWSNTTTIILHGGCVFEFKGIFPRGEVAHGYYNLKGENGFEGHISLDKIQQVSFQSKDHRGKESHAFVFEDDQGDCIFKIFLGRDAEGVLHPEQKERYLVLKNHYTAGASA